MGWYGYFGKAKYGDLWVFRWPKQASRRMELVWVRFPTGIPIADFNRLRQGRGHNGTVTVLDSVTNGNVQE